MIATQGPIYCKYTETNEMHFENKIQTIFTTIPHYPFLFFLKLCFIGSDKNTCRDNRTFNKGAIFVVTLNEAQIKILIIFSFCLSNSSRLREIYPEGQNCLQNKGQPRYADKSVAR